MDSYRIGVAIVVGAIFSILFVISLMELWCELLNVESISYRIERWAGRKRWFAYGLILAWATLLTHFFLNALPVRAAVM